MANGFNSPAEGGRTTRLEAVVWVAAWLIGLIGLLAYIFVSEQATLWVWSGLLLLALVSPTPAIYRRALDIEAW